LRPLPSVLPDVRQTCSLLVHKDFAVRFDANAYTVPPWAIGKQATVKADNRLVSIYLKVELNRSAEKATLHARLGECIVSHLIFQ
jgi:hypothetical protein